MLRWSHCFRLNSQLVLHCGESRSFRPSSYPVLELSQRRLPMNFNAPSNFSCEPREPFAVSLNNVGAIDVAKSPRHPSLRYVVESSHRALRSE